MNTTLESETPATHAASSTGALRVNAYLNFDGRCQEALDFYGEAIGAEVLHSQRFGDAPKGEGCPDDKVKADKLMHAAFRVGETTVMASDCYCENQPGFEGISLALTATDDASAQRMFTALSQGGAVRQSLAPTFFASSFGVVADRFGVCWMILANPMG